MTADTITCDELESALARLAEITRNRDNYYPDLARQIFEHIADRRKAPGSTLSPLGAPALPSAADIVRYMRATGWAHGRQGSHGAMWTKGDVEFSVPHEDHNPAWLREVVGRLASAEGRTPEATAAAIAEYRDARGSDVTAGVPAVTSPAAASAERPGTATGPATGVEAALGRVAKLAESWAALAIPGVSGGDVAAEVDAHCGRLLLDFIHGPSSAEARLSRVIALAEAWLAPGGAGLFYPAAGRAVLDAIGDAGAEEAADWRARAEAAEAKLAEVRQTIAAFFTHHGNSAAFALRSARDLAEGIRQVLDRAALEAPGGGTGEPAP